MRELELGGLRTRVSGGTDGAGGGDGPIVVLMHGYGAPGDDLVALGGALPLDPSVRWVFPAAPLSLGASFFGESRAWWPIDVARLEAAIAAGRERDMSQETPDGLAEARAAIEALLDELPAALGEGAASVPLVVGGFSQGAMLATDVALRSERDLAALVLLSGTMLAEDEWRPLMPRRSGLQVFQSHGTADPLLPFRVAERLRDALAEAGSSVAFTSFDGGHEIPSEVLAHLTSFLATVFRKS